MTLCDDICFYLRTPSRIAGYTSNSFCAVLREKISSDFLFLCAVVKNRTRDRELRGPIPTNIKCCFLEQETLSTLLNTGFYPGKKRATWKISVSLLNVLPSINKVDYYYYYYFPSVNQSFSAYARPLSEVTCLVLWLKFPLLFT